MEMTQGRPMVLCFGEVLWDCLPHALFLGGAPFNVAYHLKKLGCEPLMVSALGDDFLGERTRRCFRARKLDDRFVATDREWQTGTVEVELNAAGNATYTFPDPVAWDRIPATDAIVDAAQNCGALVFGSLAMRSGANRDSIVKLLEVAGPLKIFDVNLRPPFDDVERVLALARKADVLKLNATELGRLAGVAGCRDDASSEELVRSAELLAARSGCTNICITRGPHGALWVRNGAVFEAQSPPVMVRDTIGAGDAFTARLVHGLISGADQDPRDLLKECCALGAFVASRDGAQPDYDAEQFTALST